MSTYKQIFYQIVFSTKNRQHTIAEEHEQDLYKYIWGIINNRSGKLYRINSLPDHIHIFSDLHPSVCLSDYVKAIKVASSLWMKESSKFPLFTGWQEGYGAFTYSVREKDMISNYIKTRKSIIKRKVLRMSIDGFWRRTELCLKRSIFCKVLFNPVGVVNDN